MCWSINEVAKLSGVTSRTLRHYDHIGLLPPARTGANGYRYYEQAQLLRLQRILLLRELGVGLNEIAKVLDGERDELEALRRHHRQLLDDERRLHQLAITVATTIAYLERGIAMPAEELFEGFAVTPEKLTELETAAREQGWGGQETFDEIKRRTADWTEQDWQHATRDASDFEVRLLGLMQAGVAADDPRVHDVVAEDYAKNQRMWTADPDAYAKLGDAFVAAPELRAHLDVRDPGLAEFMRDAMQAYARSITP
jgi:DNA-binding transcriptional MerR regulator